MIAAITSLVSCALADCGGSTHVKATATRPPSTVTAATSSSPAEAATTVAATSTSTSVASAICEQTESPAIRLIVASDMTDFKAGKPHPQRRSLARASSALSRESNNLQGAGDQSSLSSDVAREQQALAEQIDHTVPPVDVEADLAIALGERNSEAKALNAPGCIVPDQATEIRTGPASSTTVDGGTSTQPATTSTETSGEGQEPASSVVAAAVAATVRYPTSCQTITQARSDPSWAMANFTDPPPTHYCLTHDADGTSLLHESSERQWMIVSQFSDLSGGCPPGVPSSILAAFALKCPGS
jgi:hypothetical protein